MVLSSILQKKTCPFLFSPSEYSSLIFFPLKISSGQEVYNETFVETTQDLQLSLPSSDYCTNVISSGLHLQTLLCYNSMGMSLVTVVIGQE